MYRNKSVQEKLMFIFSAENLSQTYRRMRYVQEYANYQRLQGLEIERKQRQVVSKKKELEQTRKAKENLLKQGETEKAKLEIQKRAVRPLPKLLHARLLRQKQPKRIKRAVGKLPLLQNRVLKLRERRWHRWKNSI